MAGKKKAAEPKVKEEVANAEEKKYTIKFVSVEGREFYEPGVVFEEVKGKKLPQKVRVMKPLIMKSGQTKTLTKEEYDFLIGKGALATEEELSEKSTVRRELLRVKSGRAEPTQEMQTISDENKNMMFVDKPFLINGE